MAPQVGNGFVGERSPSDGGVDHLPCVLCRGRGGVSGLQSWDDWAWREKRWSRVELEFVVGNKRMRRRKDLSLANEHYLSPGGIRVLRPAGHWLCTEGCVSTSLAG